MPFLPLFQHEERGSPRLPSRALQACRFRYPPHPSSLALAVGVECAPMRFLLALLLATSASAAAPRTFRVDYFHTGNATEERFSLDRLVLEPLPWPGNPSRPIDETNLGKYLFEVRDRATNRLLYSRGFASIYGEWETTAEAKEARTAPSTSRSASPLPRRPCRSSSRSATRGTPSARSGRSSSIPQDMFVDPSTPPSPGPLLPLLKNGPPEREGRPAHPRRRLHRAGARQVREGRAPPRGHPLHRLALQGAQGRLQRLGPDAPRRRVRHLPALHRHPPPLARRRHLRRLRQRALRPHLRQPLASATSPPSRPTSSWRSWSTARPTAAAASSTSTAPWPPTASGPRTSSSTSSGTTSPGSPTSTTPPTSAYLPAEDRLEPWEPNVTALKDPAHAQVEGARLAGHAPAHALGQGDLRDPRARGPGSSASRSAPSAAPSPRWTRSSPRSESGRRSSSARRSSPATVGAFEGAMYEARGYYRPQADCIMFTRDRVPFCAVCQQALSEVIDLYAGKPRGMSPPAHP